MVYFGGTPPIVIDTFFMVPQLAVNGVDIHPQIKDFSYGMLHGTCVTDPWCLDVNMVTYVCSLR